MTVETSSKPRVRLCLRCSSTGCCDGPLARPKPWLTRRQLGPALFASLLHDLFVAHLVIYGGDESITPEGATSLKADALFALEHVFGVPPAVAEEAMAAAAIHDNFPGPYLEDAEEWLRIMDRNRMRPQTVTDLEYAARLLNDPGLEATLEALDLYVWVTRAPNRSNRLPLMELLREANEAEQAELEAHKWQRWGDDPPF